MIPIDTGDRRRRHPGTVRRLATGLLIAMAGVFLLARAFEPRYPLLAWIRAFAEAAMVGALADWFAVSALFRHPLGVPIPHTAIVPRSKDRIAHNLGDFVGKNFLAPPVLREHLAAVDFAAGFVAWLREPERPRKLAERLASLVPAWLEGLDDQAIRDRLQAAFDRQLAALDVQAVAAAVLEALTAEGRHQPLVDRSIDALSSLLAEYEPAIRSRVRERTARIWRTLRIDEALADRLIRAAEEVILEMSHDHSHPWRRKFDQVIADVVADLRQGGRYREAVDAMRAEFAARPEVRAYVDGLWDAARVWLREDVSRADSLVVGQLTQGIARYATTLDDDPVGRARINRWLRAALVKIVEREGHRVSSLIAGTMRSWNAETFTRRIESYVGDDLQFIRINGTVIGGLVGVLLHAAGLLLP